MILSPARSRRDGLGRFTYQTAKRIVLHRKAHDALIADGWTEIRSHSGFPADRNIGGSGKYSDVCLHPDGSRIYVKIAPGP